MWSSSMLLSLDEAGSQNEFSSNISDNTFLRERQIDLFHQLAPLLLFPPLTPNDISFAMWAMGKAEYVIDPGIFDELALMLSSKEILKQSSTRLIAQALWSCGKMAEFEDLHVFAAPDDIDEEEGTANILPPYMKCSEKYLQHLIANRSRITPYQLAIACWAIGRLRLSNTFLVNEMGDIASNLCGRLNARETANVVWGLSKADYDRTDVVSNLITHVILSDELSEACTAQEASNMLYVLGRLQIRDEELFSALTSILSDKLHESTSQAIANSLWAHDAVRIDPPVELLSSWAQDKLGMVTGAKPDAF